MAKSKQKLFPLGVLTIKIIHLKKIIINLKLLLFLQIVEKYLSKLISNYMSTN